MARVVKVSGKVEDLTDLSLDSIHKELGGPAEPIYLRNGQTMLVNEEGIRLNLSPNLKATRLAGQIIRGHVILCSAGELEVDGGEADLGG